MTKYYYLSDYVGEDISGSHRQIRFLEILLSTEIITLVKPSGNFPGIHVFKNVHDLNFYINKCKKNGKSNKSSIRSGVLAGFFRQCKYILFLDIFNFEILKVMYLLLRINYDKPSKILISTPKFHLALAVYFTTLFFSKIKYAIDFRDAWASHPSIPRSKFRLFIEKKVIEKSFLNSTVSNYLGNEFSNNHNKNFSCLYNIATQVDEGINNFSRKESTNSDIKNFLYIGSLPLGFYNIREFIKGVEIFINDKNRKYTPKFIFIGEHFEIEKELSKMAKIYKNYFEFLPPVSHKNAIEAIAIADAVIFFAYNAPKNAGVISTKLFEYIKVQEKIIFFDIKEDSDLDKIICQIYEKSIFINNALALVNEFHSIFIKNEKISNVLNNLEKFTEIQRKKYFNHIEEFFKK